MFYICQNSKKSILKRINISNVNALQIFQLIRYGALLLIGILFSKSGLGQINIGHYETFMLIGGAFTFFWVNGFLKVMMPFSSEKNEDEKKSLIFNTFVLLFGFSVVAAILVYFLNKPFSDLLLNGNTVPMPLLLSAYIIFNSPAMLIEYIYLINNRPGKILVYGILIFSLQIAAVGLPPLLGFGLNEVIIGLFSITVIKFLWLIFILIRNSKARLDIPLLSEYLRLGAPLVLSTLLSSSSTYIDGFIITSNFSPEEFAVFQYGARELPLSLLLANSLSMAMLSNFSKADIKSPLAELKSEVYRLHWYLYPISIVLLLSSHWFFPVVFNSQFESSATIFNIYLLLVISRVLIPQTILIGRKMNGVIVRASFFEIIINVGTSLFLAKTIGIEGVAWGTFIAYMFEKVYLSIACKRKLNISPLKYLPLRIYTISTALLIFAFVLIEFFIY